MKNATFLTRLTVASLFCGGVCAQALAATPATAYLGVGAGSAQYGYSSSQCSTDVGGTCTLKSSDTGIKIFAGYNATANFALEMAYEDFGKQTGNAVAYGIPMTLSESNSALDFALVGNLPLASNFFLTGKVGDFSSHVSASAKTSSNFTGSSSGNTTNFLLGVGAGYDFTPHIVGRVELEHFTKAGDSGTDIDLVTGSIAYNF